MKKYITSYEEVSTHHVTLHSGATSNPYIFIRGHQRHESLKGNWQKKKKEKEKRKTERKKEKKMTGHLRLA